MKYGNAPFGGVVRRLVFAFAGVLFAAAFGTTAANAQVSNCPAGEFNILGGTPFAAMCSPIMEPDPATASDDGADVQEVRIFIAVARSYTGAIGDEMEVLAVVVNRSSGNVFFDSNSGDVLLPKDARFPPLPLNLLNLNADAGDMDETLLQFTGITVTGGLESEMRGQQYFSRARAPLTRADCGPTEVLTDNNAACRTQIAADCTDPTSRFDVDRCVATCPEERPDRAADGITCQTASTSPGNEQPTPPSSPATSATSAAASQRDEADYATGAGIVSGVVGVILALHYWGGDANAFAFSPDYGYSITESGYAYNFGGRVDFRKENWRLYSAAGQGNANGDFGDLRYESGGEYTADFWTAAFSETIRGDTTDWRFSLSAKADGGIWRLSPTYRFHSRLEDDETETANSLNLEGILRYNRWTISPSAGFNWRRPKEFGDNARFNLSAVRRF